MRLSIFLPIILIPACASSNTAFCMMYPAEQSDKQGDNTQPCHISFPVLTSPSLMHDTGCLGLVHWDDPAGWYGEGGGRRVQDAYLIYMQSTSCEILGWMKHKLESRLPGKISITLDIQMTPLSWQRRWTKVPLDEFDRGEGKSWLKTQHWKKRRSWHLVPSLHGK